MAQWPAEDLEGLSLHVYKCIEQNLIERCFLLLGVGQHVELKLATLEDDSWHYYFAGNFKSLRERIIRLLRTAKEVLPSTAYDLLVVQLSRCCRAGGPLAGSDAELAKGKASTPGARPVAVAAVFSSILPIIRQHWY
jgi:hypothetical protein